MKIQIAKTRAVDTVHVLDRLIFPGDVRVAKDPYSKFDQCTWWVAHDTKNKQPVAFGGIRPLNTGENYMYFVRAGVIEPYRGNGIHSRLISVRLAHAKRAGYAGVLTYTASDNPTSANNLIDHKFRLHTPHFPWVGDKYLYFIREF